MTRTLLLLVAFTGSGWAQNAGAKARVAVDELPVYLKMKAEGPPLKMLFKGDSVVIGLVLFGDDITWCAVSKPLESKRLGYVSCESLEPDKGEKPAQPEPVPVPKPPAQPIKIREIEPPPIKVRELPQHTADQLLKSARESGAIPDPAELKPPPAAAVTEAPENFVELALDRSGALRDIRMYVQRTNLISFLDRTRLAKINQKLLQNAIFEHFRAEIFDKNMAKKLAQANDPAHMPHLIAWVRSENTEAVENALRDASRADARQGLVKFASDLTAKPPPEGRLRLVHRLYDATHTTEREVHTTMSLVRAVALAMNPVLPKDLRSDARALDDSLKIVEAKYLPVMRNARLVHLLFAFRDLSDAQLEPYVAFWESTTGKWFSKNVEQGFTQASDQIGARFAKELPGRIRSQTPSTP